MIQFAEITVPLEVTNQSNLKVGGQDSKDVGSIPPCLRHTTKHLGPNFVLTTEPKKMFCMLCETEYITYTKYRNVYLLRHQKKA